MLGYTFRHQLVVTVVLLAFFCTLIHIIVIQLFIYHVIWLPYDCSLSCYYLCTLFICTSSPLYTHTHQVAFWRPVQILDALFLLCKCSRRRYASQRAGASPYLILVFLSFLSSYYFLILVISDSFVISVLYSYDIMHGCLYVLLQWSLTHYNINL